jgi:hypothetical protein
MKNNVLREFVRLGFLMGLQASGAYKRTSANLRSGLPAIVSAADGHRYPRQWPTTWCKWKSLDLAGLVSRIETKYLDSSTKRKGSSNAGWFISRDPRQRAAAQAAGQASFARLATPGASTIVYQAPQVRQLSTEPRKVIKALKKHSYR